MHRAYDTGTISATMTNIVLVLGIATAVVVLLYRTQPDNTGIKDKNHAQPTQNISARIAPGLAAPITEQSQLEIDALKAQLDREAYRLEALRKQEQLVEIIRIEDAQHEALAAQTKLAEPQAPQESTTQPTEPASANSKATKIATAEDYSTTSKPAKPERRLITPMGFPE